MAHGYPDYGMAAAISQLYGVLDLGELGVRLGAHSIVDRRGLLVLQDSFDMGIGRWSTSTVDVGDTVELLGGLGHTDGYCVYARCAGGASNEVSLTRWASYPASGRFGFEVAFKPSTWLFQAVGTMTWNKPPLSYSCGWYWDGVANTLGITGLVGGTLVIVANTARIFNFGWWSTVKVVFDVVTGKGVRAIVNGVSYSLAAYTLAAQADLSYDAYRLGLSHIAQVGHINDMWWDDVLVTLNEP